MLVMIIVFILVFGAVGVHIFRDSYKGLGCELNVTAGYVLLSIYHRNSSVLLGIWLEPETLTWFIAYN